MLPYILILFVFIETTMVIKVIKLHQSGWPKNLEKPGI